METDKIFNQVVESETSEREFARKFNKAYKVLRKGTVAVANERKEKGSENACKELKNLWKLKKLQEDQPIFICVFMARSLRFWDSKRGLLYGT